MRKQPSRRSTFFAAMAGVLAGALLVGMLPVMAANGDNMIVGATNRAGKSTWLASRGPSVMKLNNTGGNPVLDLRNGGTAAPMLVDSDVLVENLNADLLRGYEADHLVRVGFDSTTDATDSNGTALEVNMGVPTPGLLVMSGAVDAAGNTSDTYSCELRVDDTMVTGSEMFSQVNNELGSHTANSTENCVTTAVQVVDTGWYDVELYLDDRESVSFKDASLWVLYVPFDNSGNHPTP